MNNLIPRAKGGHFALDMVLEQLHYWGRNTDDSLKLTAAEVIEALVKMIDERGEATHNGLTAEQWEKRANYLEECYMSTREFVSKAFEVYPNLDLDIANHLERSTSEQEGK